MTFWETKFATHSYSQPVNQSLPSVILIGGTSHVGKSTLAWHLGELLGWQTISTDSLARHPGRPWRTPPERVPPPVAEHYQSLLPAELLADVLRHYRTLWPTVARSITQRDAPRVVEGSALWPEWVATAVSDDVRALWLTASDDFLRQRIHESSGFNQADDEQQALIRKFVARTLLYNQRMTELIQRFGLRSVNVVHCAPEELERKCLALLQLP